MESGKLLKPHTEPVKKVRIRNSMIRTFSAELLISCTVRKVLMDFAVFY